MKLTVLNDNESNGVCESSHGLSFLIEDDKKILFDVGPSKIFVSNSKKLDVNLDDVDCIVLSHGHWDHGNGLEFIKNKTLIAHPDVFMKRYRKKDMSYIGLPISKEEAQKNFNLILSKEPYNVSENVIFLGEIPRLNDFEAKKTSFVMENDVPDYVIDDSGIVIKSPKGLIVISGCSHAGICNTVNYAKKVTGENKVYAVLGGFHLKDVDEVTLKTIEFFKNENVEKVYPSHCVDKIVIDAFEKELNIGRIFSGDVIEL